MSDLTPEQSTVMDFLGDQSNIITREGNYDIWRDNILQNRPYFSKGNPSLKGLTVYVVCAGPSLDKNVYELKNISERGIIVCLDASLRYLLKRGIKPEYCVSIDGSNKIHNMVHDCDTADITLVCTPSANPKVVSSWRGDKFFVTTPYLNSDKKWNSFHLTRIVKAKKDIKAGDMLFLDDEYEVEFGGVTTIINCGGNVSTAAHHFAMQYLKAQQVVFVGLDLSWKYDSYNYAGHEHPQGSIERTRISNGTHLDWDGKEVKTSFSMLAFKRWHEQMAKMFNGSVINATEGGIFGIGQKGERLEYVEFLTLKDAIAKYTPIKNPNNNFEVKTDFSKEKEPDLIGDIV